MGCVDDANRSCCRPAVQRAFAEMRARGQPDRYCFEAAMAVYRWHHPETPLPTAMGIVEGWVAAPGPLH